MNQKNIFKKKEKENEKVKVEGKDKVKFVFEMPRAELGNFINRIWATYYFSVKFTDVELDKIEKLITENKDEVVFEYG